MNIYDEIVKKLKSKGAKGSININSEFKKMGLDSLDLMDLIVELEDKLDIRIDDDALLSIKTVSDLLNVIEELKK
ncbi:MULTISPECIES: acyl carrier protein [Mycoplasma]|uniref:Acyl carrier protein n=3 Tax=Mycoplasma TaxID=2093 RepID=S6G841_9MOLU|nr:MULTISPECIES: phosphopantetheine-binding protein [Mycoplasma]AJM72102.1 acyl carrier protein [Mycoplasma yeatsii GM274B]EOA07159.1 Acyl carrier protein [Mycoplasma yeatsii 13926]MDQ0567552.1 acyl carrier protein [Mycoplasma yeatsii]UWD34874.1 phosphopantetheine-binding protein [Mycoplasma cottewii]